MRDVCVSRLQNIARQDKSELSSKINKLIKSEVLYLLRNYFDVSGDGIDVDIVVDEYGKYNININAKANTFKVVRLFAD